MTNALTALLALGDQLLAAQQALAARIADGHTDAAEVVALSLQFAGAVEDFVAGCQSGQTKGSPADAVRFAGMLAAVQSGQMGLVAALAEATGNVIEEVERGT